MARYVYPIHGVTRRGIPYWMDRLVSAGHAYSVAETVAWGPVDGGLIHIAGPNNIWNQVPVAGSLTSNNFEVLVKFEKITIGTQNFSNTGGGIFIGSTASSITENGYTCTVGSGSSTAYGFYRRDAGGSQTAVGSTGSLPQIGNINSPYIMRVRRSGSSLQMRVWADGSAEPSTWGAEATDSAHACVNVSLLLHGYRLALKIHAIAVATGGDTAAFTIDPTDIVGGSVSSPGSRDYAQVRSASDHSILDVVKVNSSTGGWSSNIYTADAVYVRIERNAGSQQDLLFAKYGNCYLGGDFPDGIVTVEGVPSEADIRVILRSDDPIFSGALIAQAEAASSGSWKVQGLQPGIAFDVVGRHADHNDKMVANVEAVIDPDAEFILMGGVQYSAGVLGGVLVAKSATLPITAEFTGALPYGLGPSHIAVSGAMVSVNYPMREYGNFTFDLDVEDSEPSTVTYPVSITGAVRAPFVDLVAAVTPADRGNVTTNVTITIPATVQNDDIMLLSVLRRGAVTITDNNGGVWTLAAERFDSTLYSPGQGAAIYWRYATASDAGKIITLACATAVRLIGYLSVYRGKFMKLKIASTFTASSSRYDGSYDDPVKLLAPITHSSGFLVRTTSWVFATTDTGLSSYSGLTNVGPVASSTGDTKRLQVGYIHLGAPGTLSGVTINTGVGDATDIQPDVAVILDEDR